MPTQEFAFEYFSEHATKYLMRFAVIVELRDEVYGLLALHVRHESGIVQLRRPIEKRLLRTHDKNSSIQHGKLGCTTMFANGP